MGAVKGGAALAVAVGCALLSTAAAPKPETRTMQYLASVTSARPLVIHFSLVNPADSPGPAYVPRLLQPLGAFVAIEITDWHKAVVYHTIKPKLRSKLDPAKDSSYVAVEPGYTYGTLLAVDEPRLTPGNYRIHLVYSNGDYRGTATAPVGGLAYQIELPLHID
jgi:hypothetical protein